MPKDQRTKWREAKQRYRANLRNNQSQETDDSSEGDFWTS